MSREDMGKEVVGNIFNEDKTECEEEFFSLCSDIKNLENEAFDSVLERFLLLVRDNHCLAQILIKKLREMKEESST